MSLSNQSTLGVDAPPKMLHDFQRKFGQYLRNNTPHLNQQNGFSHDPSAFGLSSDNSSIPSNPSLYAQDRVTRLYQSLLFNNICGFVDRCFRVCKSLLTHDKWRYVCQQFFTTHSCHSPYFTQINQSFVDYLALPDTLSQLGLPPYFAELAHYEWMELYVDIHINVDAEVADIKTSQAYVVIAKDSLLRLNPTLQNLHYQWAVHTISADNRPTAPQDSFFLIYRHPKTHKVEFIQTNALTYALLEFIDSQDNKAVLPEDKANLMVRFASSIGFDKTQVLVDFGMPLLKQLQNQYVLYSSVKSQTTDIP